MQTAVTPGADPKPTATDSRPLWSPDQIEPLPASRHRSIQRLLALEAGEYFVAAVIFLALTVAFFNPVFRGFTFSVVGGHQASIFPWRAYPNYLDDRFPQSDQADTYYPWEVFISRSLRAGSLPLWNPESFAGQPFIANGQNAIFYPPKFFLSLIVPPDWVHDLLVIIPVFLGGLAMFVLLKEFRCGFFGALLGGVAWMFNSYLFAWIHLEIISPIAALFPVAVWCVYRAVVRKSWGMAITAGLTIGLMFLGSSILYILLVALICAVYACCLSLRGIVAAIRAGGWREALGLVLRIGIIPTVAFGICAIQILPLFALSQQSGRNPVPYDLFSKQLAVPLATFLNTFNAPPLPIGFATLWVMSFVGLPTALFALIGLVQRRPGATFGRWLAIIVVIVSIGTPATWLAYYIIPGFSNWVYLGRGLFLWNFAVAILGSVGLDACLRWSRAPRVPLLSSARATAWLTAAFRRHQSLLASAMSLLAVAAIVMTSVQLTVYGRQINPPFQLRQPQYLYPRLPLIRALEADRAGRDDTDRQRFASILLPSTATTWYPPVMFLSQHMALGFESAQGFDSLLPNRTATIWRVAQGETPEQAYYTPLPSSYHLTFMLPTTRFDLFPRLGITTLVAPPYIDGDPLWTPERYAPLQLVPVFAAPEGKVYDIVGYEPRAYIVHTAEYAETPFAALQRFSDPTFDFRQNVILEGAKPNEAISPPSPASPDVDRVDLAYRGTNDVSLDVTTTQPGWVVLADMWAPGWEASVNGRGAAVLNADYALRAVAVSAGRSQIVLRYRPAEFAAGAAISGTTVALVGAYYVVALVRRGQRNRRFTTGT